jgi:sigma54-dependent transcription regulator
MKFSQGLTLRLHSEDIEPNLEYELNKFSQKSGKHISFNKEARDKSGQRKITTLPC